MSLHVQSFINLKNQTDRVLIYSFIPCIYYYSSFFMVWGEKHTSFGIHVWFLNELTIKTIYQSNIYSLFQTGTFFFVIQCQNLWMGLFVFIFCSARHLILIGFMIKLYFRTW